MRPAQKSNRSRGRGNRKGGGGGNNINRVYDSAGPEGKVRGTPQQIIDKYLTLARDAQTSGDRVAAENFLQHAEHYQRILIQAAAAQEQARSNLEQNEAARETQPESDPTAEPIIEKVADRATQGAGEIDGMTTIDSGTDTSLLVDAGSTPQAQSRQNGDGRRRRSKPAAEPAADTAPESSESGAQVES